MFKYFQLKSFLNDMDFILILKMEFLILKGSKIRIYQANIQNKNKSNVNNISSFEHEKWLL